MCTQYSKVPLSTKQECCQENYALPGNNYRIPPNQVCRVYYRFFYKAISTASTYVMAEFNKVSGMTVGPRHVTACSTVIFAGKLTNVNLDRINMKKKDGFLKGLVD